MMLLFVIFTKYLPLKNGEVEALGSHVAQSSHPMKGILVTMYNVTTTIVCFTVLINALEMKGSRFRCKKLSLLFFLRLMTLDILLLVHTDMHILT